VLDEMKLRRSILRFCFPLLVFAAWLPPSLPAQVRPDHPALPNFDHRQPPGQARAGRSPQKTAGEARLREKIPGLRIRWDERLNAPSAVYARDRFLSGPPGAGGAVPPRPGPRPPSVDPIPSVQSFLDDHADLFGFGREILAPARLQRQYVTPRNGMQTLVWQQQWDGLDVYQGLLVGNVSRDGELISLSSGMMARLENAVRRGSPQGQAAIPEPRISARRALVLAAAALEEPKVSADQLQPVDATPAGKPRRQRFRVPPLPGEAEVRLVWLPVEENRANLCWEVELTRRLGGERYRVLLDSQTGQVLIRWCLTVYLKDVTYRVFTGDSPAPLSPGWPDPSTNQAPRVPRELVTLSALSTNASPTGWIHDEENETRGNNVDAHLDRNGDNLPDLPRPQGTGFHLFDFPLDLDQSPLTYGDASTVQLFYWCNWMHDQLYDLGFTEAAGNFQKDNFGRGGLGDDALEADAQDGSGVNNANFTPTPDGQPPRIQMFLFDGPEPNRDGSLDADVVLHEYTHGLTDRLVGGGAGIFAWQTLGLGEGWSDFYALSLLGQPGDDPNGNYVEGGYVTYLFNGLTQNYYYGIRRYPYSTDPLRNPLTFQDIDPDLISSHPGIPRSPNHPFDPQNAGEVHRVGEVWCEMLWEARANFIAKYGFETGRRLIMQTVTDALKLSPPNPTFVQARDAILLADRVDNGGENQYELWRAFAKRGLGLSASAPSNATTSGVKEAFDFPDFLGAIAPANLAFSGPVGSLPAPFCREVVLTNYSENPLAWEAYSGGPWLNLAPASGTLPPGGSTRLSVCLNADTAQLPAGVTFDTITVSNLNSQMALGRAVQIQVVAPARMPFAEDFESGALASYWVTSGTALARTQLSTNDEPASGAYHLTMGSGAGGLFSRNEMTLFLDLEGFTNVTLRFQARQFQDHPDAPPDQPFLDGADFDGVAVSPDGLIWYGVQGFPNLERYYTPQEIDLDAVLARYGLSYNGAFRIRFNHYGDKPVPTGGIALDAISIEGLAPRRFSVTLPPWVLEQQGTVVGAAQVSLPVPVAADLTVQLTSSDPAQVMVPASVVIPAGSTSAVFNLTPVDNEILDGTRTVLISASAPGHIRAGGELQILDDEFAVLTLSVPASAREGQGVLEAKGEVTVDQAPANDIRVTLASSDTTEVILPSFVVLPAGETSVRFDVEVVDDSEIDGSQVVILTASVPNWTADVDAMTVEDNESRALIVSAPSLVDEGNTTLPGAGQVSLTGTWPADVDLAVSSSDETALSAPALLTIPAGKTRVSFPLTIRENALATGPKTVFITATAPDFFPGSAAVKVLDRQEPPVPYHPDPPHQSVEQPLAPRLSWRLGVDDLMVNGDFERGNLTGWSLGNGLNGSFVINDGTVDPLGPEGPVAPYQGGFSALSQQIGPGRQEIYQDVLLPVFLDSFTLSWVQRVRNHAGHFATNQSFRVEIRDQGNRVSATPFTTQPGDSLDQDWRELSFDLSPWRGQRVRIAFVEEDEAGFLNAQIDAVHLYLGRAAPVLSEVYFGTNPELDQPQLLGVTTNLSWTVNGLEQGVDYYWRVVARVNALRRLGPVWQFRTRATGPLHHFDWDPVAASQGLNAPFPVTLTARDELGNVQSDFEGAVRLSGTRHVGARPVQVLVFNAYADTVRRYRNTIGAIASYFTNFVETTTQAADPSVLQGFLAGKDVFLVVAQSFAPTGRMSELGANWRSLLQEFVSEGGIFIVCSYNRDEQNLLDAGGFLRFLNPAKTGTFAGADLQITPGDPLVEGLTAPFHAFNVASFALEDPDVAVFTADKNNPVVVRRRLGTGQALLIGTDYATNRSGLDRVLANAVALAQAKTDMPVRVTPAFSGYFNAGTWSGSVRVLDAGPDITLTAESDLGPKGVSGRFEVVGTNDLSVEIEDAPDPIQVGQLLSYDVRVRNSGPDEAPSVLLKDALPAQLELITVSNAPGPWLVTNGMIECDLGTLPGGATVLLTFLTRTLGSGTITNAVEVASAVAESYQLNNQASAVTRINPPGLTINDALVTEGNGAPVMALFTVTLFPASGQTVACRYATSNWTAQAGMDYQAIAGVLVFPPGTTNQTLAVPVLGDLLDEDLEFYYLNLFSPTNALVLRGQGLGSIIDDDATPELRIGDAQVAEGDSGEVTNAAFLVSLSFPAGRDVTVDYTVDAESAEPLTDYTPVSGTLLFPSGTTNQTILVPVIGDERPEPDETFLVRLLRPVGASIAVSQGRGVIRDNDLSRLDHFQFDPIESPQFLSQPFSLTVSARDRLDNLIRNYAGTALLSGLAAPREMEVVEASGSWEFPLGAGSHDQRLQSIYLASEQGGPARLTALAFYVEIPVPRILRRFTIRLRHTPLADYREPSWEGDGWTTVYQQDEAVAETGWHVFNFNPSFEFNGSDNLMVDFSFNNGSYSENGQVRFAATDVPRSLTFSTDSGFGDPLDWRGSVSPPALASAGVPAIRFQAEQAVALTPALSGGFLDGVWSGAVAVLETGTGVQLRAQDETGHVGLSGEFNVVALDDLGVTAALAPVPVPLQGQAVYTINVTNTGPTVATGVRLTNALPAGVSLISSQPSQGACQAADGMVWCGLGTMPAQSFVTLSLTVASTSSRLLTNRVEVVRNEPEAYRLNNVAVTVAPVAPPRLTMEDISVPEGDAGISVGEVRVRLSQAIDQTVTVPYETLGGTATNIGLATSVPANVVLSTNLNDFNLAGGMLTFPPGVSEQTIQVEVIGDTRNETNEYFLVSLGQPTNAVVETALARVTILDDDPVPEIRIDDLAMEEGDFGITNFTINVRLSRDSGQVIRVQYAMSNGTATAFSDYVPLSGTLLFPPGLTNRLLFPIIYGDQAIEPDETFTVHLSNPLNAVLGNDTATMTILNDDGLPGVVDHFSWSPVAPVQVLDQPFIASVSARDYYDNTVSNFDGFVSLLGRDGGLDQTVGSGSSTWPYPLATGFHDARSEVIYLADELGGAHRIRGLALELVAVPLQVLNHFTIRMKHTALDRFSLAAWDVNDWITVYQSDQAGFTEGWNFFLFPEPFAYNGALNLMVDFSFNNSYFTVDTVVKADSVSTRRSLSVQTDSAFGDPLLWSGAAPPVPALGKMVPQTRFVLGTDLPISPSYPVELVNGRWTGEITVRQTGDNVSLAAFDQAERVGVSSSFAVVALPDSDLDGLPDAWERDHFGSLNAPGGGPNDDPDGDGADNLAEYRAGTDPLDPGSLLIVTSLSLAGSDVRVRFLSVAGKWYRLERTGDLSQAQWTTVADLIPGTGSDVEVTDAQAAGERVWFYRVRLLP
jgi:uncharacterized repeat protein (TIGR01451 family)